MRLFYGLGLVLGVALVFLAFFLTIAVPAWILMILVGILHGMVPEVPAYGFWVFFVLVLILRMVVAIVQSNRDSRNFLNER